MPRTAPSVSPLVICRLIVSCRVFCGYLVVTIFLAGVN